jgi:hypothetical protein
MPHARRYLPAAAILLALAATARADDKCSAKLVIGGKPVSLKNCEVAMYDEKGVTLVFMEAPISAEEATAFQWNSYPKDKDAGGKARTMISLGFCPGGGKTATPSPGAVPSVEMSINHATSPMLGRQWVFDLPKDKAVFKIEKLSGNLALGGKLAGRMTGGKKSDEVSYSWEIDFDVQLPKKAAAAGPGCGS